jgi:hypothetical protein
MRRMLLGGILAVLAGCSAPAPARHAAPAAPRTRFQDDNFGVAFCHSDAISTTYNPHGGADRILLAHRGKPIGGVTMRPRPPAGSLEQFIESGRQYYAAKYNASRIDYELITTPRQMKLHHFEVALRLDGSDYLLHRYVHLRTPGEEAGGKASMPWLAASISFEFLIAAQEHATVFPEVKTVLDTFHIAEIP